MLAFLWLFCKEFCYGVFQSFYGLTLLKDLDSDEKCVPLNSVPQKERQDKTVLQRRRENGGIVHRPAEQIVRYKVPAWKRIVQCVCVNLACIALLKLLYVIFWFILSYFTDYAEHGAECIRFLVVPVFLFFKILTTLWFSDVSSSCLKVLKLREPPPVDFRLMVADLIFSTILGIVFLVQSICMLYLPIPGLSKVISFSHMALLNSMYSFEYSWIARGFTLKSRIRRLEFNWPFFIGFGVPLTFFTTLTGNFIIDGCIYGALFPLFIISAYKADFHYPNRLKDPSQRLPNLPFFYPSYLVTDKIMVTFSNYILAS